MKLIRECDVLVDLYLCESNLIAVRGNGSRIVIPLNFANTTCTCTCEQSMANSVVYFDPAITSGTKLGALVVDGTRYFIYAPENPVQVYNIATPSSDGLMSASDKVLLDSVASNLVSLTYTPVVTSGTKLGTFTIGSRTFTIYAPIQQQTTYTLPTATSSTLGGVKIGSNISVSSGTISLSKDNVVAALGYTPASSSSTTTLPEPMVPSDNAVDIYNASNVSVYGGDFRMMTYTAPSNGYCSITGKLTVRVTDLTNGMDANSFSYLNDSSNLGAAASIPVKKGHNIQFVWHKKAEETTTGTDKFSIRFIPAT